MNSSHIVYVQREGITPRAELSALVAVYRYVLDCHTKNEAAPEGRPDAMEGSSDDRARSIIPNR